MRYPHPRALRRRASPDRAGSDRPSPEPASKARLAISTSHLARAAVIVACVAVLLGAGIAHAQHVRFDGASSMTGVPIEWLFGAIGALGMIVYADMRRAHRDTQRALENLAKVSERRARRADRTGLLVQQICARLDIHVPRDEDI